MMLECVGSHWTVAPEDKSNGRGHREAKPELPASVLPVAKSRRWRHGDRLLGSPLGRTGSAAAEVERGNCGATQWEPPQADPMTANRLPDRPNGRFGEKSPVAGYGRQDSVTTGSYPAPEFNGGSSAAIL